MKKVLAFSILILLFSCNLIFAAQDEQIVISSFQDIVKKHIESYSDDPRIMTYFISANKYSPKSYWIKSKCTVLSDYSFDIQKTNSIITPYTGYVIYKMQTWVTDEQPTKEAAETATSLHTIGGLSNCRITFAFQGDAWIVKKYEYQSNYDGTWYDVTDKDENMTKRMLVK